MSTRWFVLAAAALGCHNEPEVHAPPQAPPASSVRTDQVKRGEYVSALAGCTVCHQHGGGNLHAPNITSDREAGIATWSDAQIIKAVREGIRPDGQRLAPIMPYPFYHAMTDSDAESLVAFLRTLPADPTPVARGQSAMKPIELPPATGNVDRVEDLAAHGQYVASLMHCAACHGPDFAGQKLEDIVAPNITPDRDTGIGSWSEKLVIRAVREMKLPSGVHIRPPMRFYKAAWANLADDDARALAFFLKTLPAEHRDTGTEQARQASASP